MTKVEYDIFNKFHQFVCTVNTLSEARRLAIQNEGQYKVKYISDIRNY